MRQLLDGLYRTCAWLAGGLVFVIGVIVVLQILGRLVNLPLPGAHEAAAFLMASAVFLALAWTGSTGRHIRATLLVDKLSAKARWYAELWSTLVTGAVSACLSVFVVQLAWESWMMGEMSEGLMPIAVFLPKSAMALGVMAFFVETMDELVQLITSGRCRAMSGEVQQSPIT